MTAKQVYTRFRAYQLGQAGSSFSYYANNKFTLIEARVTDSSRDNLNQELQLCGKETVDTLHITSWDQDHCAETDLQEILEVYKPKKIEFPGYTPETDCGKNCRKMILEYKSTMESNGKSAECVAIDPEYIKGLDASKDLGYRDILYWPKDISSENANDNSVVKFLRYGAFNILSLGDIHNIAITRFGGWSFKNEVDVLILAHHGANCPTNSEKFLRKISPQIAVCSSNYGNQHDHPKQEVRDRLNDLKIPIFTTKTGDIIIESIPPHDQHFKITNLKANSTEISSEDTFQTKKYHFLSMNEDSHRNLRNGTPYYRKKFSK